MYRFFLFLILILCIFFSSFFSDQEDGTSEGAVSEIPGEELLLKGIDAFSQGKKEDAYPFFQEASRTNPEYSPPGVIAALLSSQAGDTALVYYYLDRAVSESPDDPEPWFRLARFAAEEKRFSELEILLEKGDSLLTSFAESNKTLSRTKFLKGESIALAARLAEGRGDLAQAEEKLNQYIDLYPHESQGYLSLGFLLLEKGERDKSIAVFNRAKELDPNSLTGWLTAASLLYNKGETAAAVQMIEDNWKNSPLSASDLSRITSLFFKQGRLADARTAADRIPDGLDRYKWDGLLAYSAGEYEAAEKAYRKALLISSDDFETTNGLILAIADQGDTSTLQDALDQADRFRRRYPQSDEAAGTLAWVEFHLGKIDRAEDILLPILDRGGLTPTNAYYLACVTLFRKDTALAAQLLRSALARSDFFPKRSEAEKLLKSIEETK